MNVDLDFLGTDEDLDDWTTKAECTKSVSCKPVSRSAYFLSYVIGAMMLSVSEAMM